jgi:hypothetical protein
VSACPCSSWSSCSPCFTSYMGSSRTPLSPCACLGGGRGSSAIGARKRRTPEPAVRGLRSGGGIARGVGGLALRALETGDSLAHALSLSPFPVVGE